MTLAYDTPLDRRFGIEYCRRNVTASLGFLGEDEETGEEVYAGREINPAPTDMRKRYPKDIADIGYDWSPIKLYHRKLTKVLAGRPWRLSLTVRNRAECADESKIKATLIVTVRSFDSDDSVYSEMVREMEYLGWVVQNLELRSREREEFGEDEA